VPAKLDLSTASMFNTPQEMKLDSIPDLQLLYLKGVQQKEIIVQPTVPKPKKNKIKKMLEKTEDDEKKVEEEEEKVVEEEIIIKKEEEEQVVENEKKEEEEMLMTFTEPSVSFIGVEEEIQPLSESVSVPSGPSTSSKKHEEMMMMRAVEEEKKQRSKTIDEMLMNPSNMVDLSDTMTVQEIREKIRDQENQKYMTRRETEEKVRHCIDISEHAERAVKNMQQHVRQIDLHFRFLRQIMAIDDSEIESYVKELMMQPVQEEEEVTAAMNDNELMTKGHIGGYGGALKIDVEIPMPKPKSNPKPKSKPPSQTKNNNSIVSGKRTVFENNKDEEQEKREEYVPIVTTPITNGVDDDNSFIQPSLTTDRPEEIEFMSTPVFLEEEQKTTTNTNTNEVMARKPSDFGVPTPPLPSVFMNNNNQTSAAAVEKKDFFFAPLKPSTVRKENNYYNSTSTNRTKNRINKMFQST